MSEVLLSIRNLSVTFQRRRGGRLVHAVDDVTFDVPVGQVVALVGESGSGKSTIGNAIVGLAPVTSGAILLHGQEIASPTRKVDRRRVSQHVQIIFQDPYGSLNPSRTIEQTLIEPLSGRPGLTASREAVGGMLQAVGLPREASLRYPGSFSGGQRQRIAIARALMGAPELVICDEPVSALDVSVQAQVLNLLADLQQRRGVAYLFVSHDVAIVKHIAHQVVVLYRGRVMESGPADVVCVTPRHPYTQALLAAAPIPDPGVQHQRRRERHQLRQGGDVGLPLGPGCPFTPRCRFAVPQCQAERPALRKTDLGSTAACHRLEHVTEVLRSPGRVPGSSVMAKTDP
jgi:oligopeptide/dipeptide ABC transporter ATP-binding protein